ncbi:hypothetical protein [Pedobacter cryoconitis]|uniref:hypothetical protein n=1 Tax=Pedobacter cryoconitis TaxID=188932 RepID=UPI001609F7CA|nr:hypothetical protein [Pedobacter cryoconitis]MBB5645908.1 hypothetical protein [Pedobacter cryoconitis]
MAFKTLFYSWQSDLDPDQHHYLIRDALKSAIKIINKEIDFELSLDKDTQKTSGSPDIVDTILKKIRMADIFVADVTIINPGYAGRKTPNPNVLIELGYAIKALGWERIICVVNTDQCRPEDLPFDIRNNRTSTYSVNKAGVKGAEKNLTDIFTMAIRAILDDYEGILERFTKDEYLGHDKAIFEKFNEIASQVEIFESLDILCTSLSINKTHYYLWNLVENFRKGLENHFLNVEIQETFEAFADLLNKIHLLAAQKLFPQNLSGMKYIAEYETQGIPITPEIRYEVYQTHWYKIPDSPADGDWNAYGIRVSDLQTEFNRQTEQIEAAYKAFRLSIKKHLLI